MDIYHKYIIDVAGSIKLFAGNDETFNMGEWRKWHNACLREGKILETELFKNSNTKLLTDK